MARDAYTYLHVVMVAGVIVAAVGDELVIAHPDEVLHGAELIAVCAGPAIYLLAQTLFRLRMAGSLSRKRLGGAIACVAAAGIGAVAPALVLAVRAAGDHDRGDRGRAGQRGAARRPRGAVADGGAGLTGPARAAPSYRAACAPSPSRSLRAPSSPRAPWRSPAVHHPSTVAIRRPGSP